MWRVKRKNLLIFMFFVLCGITVCFINDPVPAFIFVTVIFALIAIRAQFSFFTVFAFIMLFSYLQVVIYKKTGITSGMLSQVGKSIPFYLTEMTVSFVSFFLTELYFVWFSKLIEKEKALYQTGYVLSASVTWLFMAVAIVLVVLLFPSFPTFKMNLEIRRTQGITEIYGFLLLALCLAALTIDTSYKHKSLIFGYVFIIFWIFGHGERVEILGFIIYYVIKLLNHYRFGVKNFLFDFKMIGLIFMIGAILIIGTWIGMTRLSNELFTFLEILQKLIVQSTCSDVMYIFDCAVDMFKKGNLLHGYTYLDYLLQLIPASSGKYSAPFVIRKYYFTVGGAFFFTEPMMNFGIIGTILSNIGFFLVMRLMLDRSTKLKAYMWVPIVIEIFRITWYGRSTWILSTFIEMPLIYYGIKQIFRKFQMQTHDINDT